MRFGIRGKLVGTLMLAGLLPLGLSLAATLYAVEEARTRFITQSFRAMVSPSASTSPSAERFKISQQLPNFLEPLYTIRMPHFKNRSVRIPRHSGRGGGVPMTAVGGERRQPPAGTPAVLVNLRRGLGDRPPVL